MGGLRSNFVALLVALVLILSVLACGSTTDAQDESIEPPEQEIVDQQEDIQSLPEDIVTSDELVSINLFEDQATYGDTTRLGKGWVSGIVFSPTEDVLMLSSSLGVYSYRSNDLSLIQLSYVDSSLFCIAISPDGEILALGSSDSTAILWDAHDGEQLAILDGRHPGYVESIAFSPHGEFLASGLSDGTIFLWDVHSAELLATLEGHTGVVHSVAFSPDSNTLASGSSDGTIVIWDVNALITK